MQNLVTNSWYKETLRVPCHYDSWALTEMSGVRYVVWQLLSAIDILSDKNACTTYICTVWKWCICCLTIIYLQHLCSFTCHLICQCMWNFDEYHLLVLPHFLTFVGQCPLSDCQMNAKFIEPLHSSTNPWKVGKDPSSSSWELVAPKTTNAWQSLAYISLGTVMSPSSEY